MSVKRTTGWRGGEHAVREALCDHCGAVCSAGVVTRGELMFCCAGCRLVHELLADDAVCRVMDDATVAGERFTRLGIPRFDALDDERFATRFIRYVGPHTTQCELSLPTIHCASCIWTLENLHRLDSAVVRSEVNFLHRTLSVTYRHDDLTFRQLVELCTRLGYEPDLRREQDSARERVSSMRSLIMKLGVAGFAFGNAMIFSAPDYLAAYHGDPRALTPELAALFAVVRVALSVPVLVYSASEYFSASWMALRKRIISLDVPVAVGLIALFARSMWDIATGHGTGYLDSFTGLVFFLLTARLVQTKSFHALSFDRTYASFFPLSASIETADRGTRTVPLSDVCVDDIVRVRHEEIIPADGILVDSHAHVDYSFVSGEAEISEVVNGAVLYAGGRVIGRDIRYRVTRTVSHGHLTQLWNASVFHRDKVRRAESISRTFALLFTIGVLLIACVSALMWWPDASMAVSTAVAVLIVACPCALTLASPFTYGAAMTMLGRSSLYVRSAEVVADLSGIDTIVFDKTGTLTASAGQAVRFVGAPLNDDERQALCSVMSASVHPLSRAVVRYLCGGSIRGEGELRNDVSEYHEIPGKGITCTIRGRHVRIGSRSFVMNDSPGSEWDDENVDGTDGSDAVSRIHVMIDGTVRGCFSVESVLRDGVREMIAELRKTYDVYVVSGDSDRQREMFRGLVADDHLLFHCQPHEKMRFIEQLQAEGRKVAMIGDGVNDAGALRQAECGIAVSDSTGSFTPASDAILSGSAVHGLARMLRIARYARRILVLAFAVSLVYNAIGITMACSGRLTPVFAAFFMPLSSWSVVGLSYGLMKLYEARSAPREAHSAQEMKVRGMEKSPIVTVPSNNQSGE